MPEVFVGAGSNADPEARLRRAVGELERRFGAVRCSSVYRGRAVGAPAPDYLNLVMAFSTERTVEELGAELRAIEALAGRTRQAAISGPVPPNGTPHAGGRVCELDLDLLLYGCLVDAQRRLPRPGLFELPFVLVPLAELAPELVHPVTAQRCGGVAKRERGALENLGSVAALA